MSLDKQFEEEVVERRCQKCTSTRSIRREIITEYPEVLVLQYMRFNSGLYKIGHDIFSNNWLKLNNVMYQLIGIVVHIGEAMNSGHYYSITRCWDNGQLRSIFGTITINFLNSNFDLEFEYV